MGGKVENEDDLQVLADNVVQEESEELVFEETESDVEVDDDMHDEKPKKRFYYYGIHIRTKPYIYACRSFTCCSIFII